MNSTVLARKYRPKGFDSMVGQGHVVQALGNALTQQRLHHAYLFTGTRGVGKTTVSRILAKSLNCVGADGQGTITASPCGQCQPCRDIDSGRFVDYVELDAASNRGVEEISQLLEQAVYKPVVGRFKVYLIDEVHMLSNTAFNAMLKTLEEPPDYLKFVLATTDPQKVPVTVLSRCLQFNLRPMAAQTVQEHLQHVLGIEGISFDAGALRLLSRAARGSMRDAMSLADQAIAFGGGGLEESAVRQMLGSVDRQHVQRLIEAVAANDGAALVATVDTLRQLGLSAAGTLEELATALQRMAVLQAVAMPLDADDPDAATWHAMAPLLAPDETQLFYSLCLQGRAELALAPDEYSGLLMVLLRLLAFKPGQLVLQGGTAPPKAQGSAAQREAAEPVTQLHQQPVDKVAEVVAKPVPQADAAGVTRSPARPGMAPAAPVAPVAHVRPAVPAPLAAAPAAPPKPAPAPVARQEPPPWESLPPEADAGWANGEQPAVAMAPDDFDQATPSEWSPPPEEARGTSRRMPEAFTPSLTLPPPGSDPLSDDWAELVAALDAQGTIVALVRELAMQAQCVAQSNDGGRRQWRLVVERESLRGEMQTERLAAALSAHLGSPVSLLVEGGVAVNTPAQREQVARALRQHEAEALIQGDELVRSLLIQHPGARIVAGSVRPI